MIDQAGVVIAQNEDGRVVVQGVVRNEQGWTECDRGDLRGPLFDAVAAGQIQASVSHNRTAAFTGAFVALLALNHYPESETAPAEAVTKENVGSPPGNQP